MLRAFNFGQLHSDRYSHPLFPIWLFPILNSQYRSRRLQDWATERFWGRSSRLVRCCLHLDGKGSTQVDELQVGPNPLLEELAALISDGVAPEGYPFELWPICPDEFLTAARTDVVEFQMNAGEVLQPIYHFQEEAAFISNVVIICLTS